MGKTKTYPEYADFGQEWLGKLPAQWQVMRTKLLFDLVADPAPVGNSEELLSVYTALGVKPRKELEARGNKASTTDNYWIVKKGDIIVNKLLAWMGAVGISEYNGVTSPAYDILRAKEGVNPYFYNYLFRSPIASREFKRHSRGIMDMRLRLYFTRFGDIKLPYPSLEEQNKIVSYIQFKLTKIDRFIHKKKQLIKLLHEQKAAIINQAVTKGLNPNVPMKDSGIEWLGEVPEHWKLYKLKYLVSKPIAGQWGQEPNGDQLDIICLRVADFTDIYTKADDLTIRNLEAKEDQILEQGDLLIEKSGGGEKTPVGRVVMFNHPFKAVTSNFVSKVSVKVELVKSEYLLFVFKTINNTRWNIRSVKQTTGIQNLDTYSYLDNWVFIPEIDEQRKIVEQIYTETKTIDKTISTIEKEITLTQEYKTALIAEAVTGKIDVREWKLSASGFSGLEDEQDLNGYEIEEEVSDNMSMVAEDEANYDE